MIQDILEAKLYQAGFEEGVNVFRNFMPADCVIGVMTRWPLTGLAIDPYIPNYYKGRIQVVLRHKSPVEGAVMAARVQDLLTLRTAREHHLANAERGEVHLDIFQPETLPITFPRLDGNGFEWSQHFSCAFGVKPPNK